MAKKTTKKKVTRKKTIKKKVTSRKKVIKKKVTKKKVIKEVIDKMEGLKVKCSCGVVLTSLLSFNLNVVDIGKWACNSCGETYLIQTKIQKLGQGNLPEKKLPIKRKNIRMKCECGSTMYWNPTSYLNRLPKRSRWRCVDCGLVYLLLVSCDCGM